MWIIPKRQEISVMVFHSQKSEEDTLTDITIRIRSKMKQYQICITSSTNSGWTTATVEAEKLIIVDKHTVEADGVKIAFSDNIVEVSINGKIIHY